MRTALITGTSRGLGAEMADHFLAMGWSVIGLSRSPSSISHPHFTDLQCDISNQTQIRKIFNEFVIPQKRQVELLVNNAAIANLNFALTQPAPDIEKALAVNLMAPLFLIQECSRVMHLGQGGLILNISSIAGQKAFPGSALYGACKAGLEHLTRSLAFELAGLEIRINSIALGPMQKGMIAAIPSEVRTALLQHSPFRRPVESEEVFHAMDFFLNSKSQNITGQTLNLGFC